MEIATMFSQEFFVIFARIGLIVFGMSLAYFCRIWALNEALGN